MSVLQSNYTVSKHFENAFVEIDTYKGYSIKIDVGP
jgi:hypothetical protein